MRGAFMSVVGGLSVMAVGVVPSWADDRSPTAEERERIEASLRAEGYVAWDEIELDDGLWEVDDARTADGREFDLKLSPKTFEIVERDED